MAPERLQLERLAPERKALERLALERSTYDRLARNRGALARFAQERKAPNRLVLFRLANERLTISLTLKIPDEYSNDCLQKRWGSKLKLKKGDTLRYYKCDEQIIVCDQSGKPRTRTVSGSDDSDDISYAKYKEILINSVNYVLEILGYSVEKDLLAKRKLL